MLFSSWLRNRTSTRPSDQAATSRSAARFRPQLESLGDRLVPTTLTVTGSGAIGFGSLHDAIALAQSGDTIVFAPKLIGGQVIHLGGNEFYYPNPVELLINKNLTIQGPGAGKLTIDGDHEGRAFEIAPGAQVTISGLTIRDGVAVAGHTLDPGANDGFGGGILNEGALTLSGCTVTYNTGSNDRGGGIANVGTMTMSGCTVTHNAAAYGGGVYNSGALTITGSTITNNTAVHGDGAYNSGALTVTGSTITNNTAFYGTSADLDNTGTFSASNSTIGSKKYK